MGEGVSSPRSRLEMRYPVMAVGLLNVNAMPPGVAEYCGGGAVMQLFMRFDGSIVSPPLLGVSPVAIMDDAGGATDLDAAAADGAAAVTSIVRVPITRVPCCT